MQGLYPGYQKKTNFLDPNTALRIALCILCLIFVFLAGSYAGYVLGFHEAFYHDINRIHGFNDHVIGDTATDDGEPAIALTQADIVNFAPKWMFHNAEGGGYPMAPQLFYDYITTESSGSTDGSDACVQGKENGDKYCENTDFSNIYTGDVPTLYSITYCAYHTRIKYYIPYGFQHSCETCFGSGSHQGGFESVTVLVNGDNSDVYGAYFKQHKGHHFRSKGDLNMDGTHVKAYVGQWAHGTYHNEGGSLIDATYYGDPRNNDKSWIPDATELLDIAAIGIYSFSGTATPPSWNGKEQTWMKVSLESEYSNSANDADKDKYGKEFFNKIEKLKSRLNEVCYADLGTCDGQQSRTEEGCKKCTCLVGTEYEDLTSDHIWRCKEGCGSKWTGAGPDLCVKKNKFGVVVDTKSRTNYGRDNQPTPI